MVEVAICIESPAEEEMAAGVAGHNSCAPPSMVALRSTPKTVHQQIAHGSHLQLNALHRQTRKSCSAVESLADRADRSVTVFHARIIQTPALAPIARLFSSARK